MNKAETLEEFHRLWNALVANGHCRADDVIAKRELWGNVTDRFCKDGLITLRQYETWVNPF